jgi:hypothetical protein
MGRIIVVNRDRVQPSIDPGQHPRSSVTSAAWRRGLSPSELSVPLMLSAATCGAVGQQHRPSHLKILSGTRWRLSGISLTSESVVTPVQRGRTSESAIQIRRLPKNYLAPRLFEDLIEPISSRSILTHEPPPPLDPALSRALSLEGNPLGHLFATVR